VLPKIKKIITFKTLFYILLFLFLTVSSASAFFLISRNNKVQKQISVFTQKINSLNKNNKDLSDQLSEKSKAYEELKSQDQVKNNQALKLELGNIKSTYSLSVTAYENLIVLKESGGKYPKLDNLYTDAIVFLTKENYSSASAKLKQLETNIVEGRKKIEAAFKIPATVVSSNNPPNSGLSKQKVTTDTGDFMVTIISANLDNTKVIVDTISESDCFNNCPTTHLVTYINRSNAYAGMNGAYYCPYTYPQCAGKTNSFDLLIMNKNKYYFNSLNNVYSTNPAVIFGGSYIRFVERAQEWGRDTGVDSVISNFPLLVFNNEIKFFGNNDTKMTGRGPRGFVANKGKNVYIGFVHNATMSESAKVLKTMGMENAMNLDAGGSAALWYNGGYKIGPGRELTNVILFIKK